MFTTILADSSSTDTPSSGGSNEGIVFNNDRVAIFKQSPLNCPSCDFELKSNAATTQPDVVGGGSWLSTTFNYLKRCFINDDNNGRPSKRAKCVDIEEGDEKKKTEEGMEGKVTEMNGGDGAIGDDNNEEEEDSIGGGGNDDVNLSDSVPVRRSRRRRKTTNESIVKLQGMGLPNVKEADIIDKLKETNGDVEKAGCLLLNLDEEIQRREESELHSGDDIDEDDDDEVETGVDENGEQEVVQSDGSDSDSSSSHVDSGSSDFASSNVDEQSCQAEENEECNSMVIDQCGNDAPIALVLHRLEGWPSLEHASEGNSSRDPSADFDFKDRPTAVQPPTAAATASSPSDDYDNGEAVIEAGLDYNSSSNDDGVDECEQEREEEEEDSGSESDESSPTKNTWLCCDMCDKWRMLYPGLSAEEVEKQTEMNSWCCKDNIYDEDRQCCEAIERKEAWMVKYWEQRVCQERDDDDDNDVFDDTDDDDDDDDNDGDDNYDENNDDDDEYIDMKEGREYVSTLACRSAQNGKKSRYSLRPGNKWAPSSSDKENIGNTTPSKKQPILCDFKQCPATTAAATTAATTTATTTAATEEDEESGGGIGGNDHPSTQHHALSDNASSKEQGQSVKLSRGQAIKEKKRSRRKKNRAAKQTAKQKVEEQAKKKARSSSNDAKGEFIFLLSFDLLCNMLIMNS